MGKRYYDNYDYEEAYKEQCKKLEEAEMERWMKEGWVNCLYRTSTYKSTNTESNTTLLESMVYPSFKFKRNNGANSPFQLGEADRKHIAGIGVDVPCAKRGQKEQWRNIKGGRT